MAWRVTYTFEDDQTPTKARRTKTFTGDFADYAAASAAEAALRTDLLAASNAGIARVQLTEDTTLTPATVNPANVFEVASVTLPITSVKNVNFQLPSPIPAIQVAGNTIDTSNALWQALVDNFVSGEWQVSDGEHVDTSISYGTGKLIYVRSGARFS